MKFRVELNLAFEVEMEAASQAEAETKAETIAQQFQSDDLLLRVVENSSTAVEGLIPNVTMAEVSDVTGAS